MFTRRIINSSLGTKNFFFLKRGRIILKSQEIREVTRQSLSQEKCLHSSEITVYINPERGEVTSACLCISERLEFVLIKYYGIYNVKRKVCF